MYAYNNYFHTQKMQHTASMLYTHVQSCTCAMHLYVHVYTCMYVCTQCHTHVFYSFVKAITVIMCVCVCVCAGECVQGSSDGSREDVS